MTKIWQKGERQGNQIIEAYNAGTDFMLDMYIFLYDIRASQAHARMLGSIGVITSIEADTLITTLSSIGERFSRGEIVITPDDEDCHTVIERLLIEACGDLGKKIHTGRSRNDQVLTAVRLYSVEKQQEVSLLTEELISSYVAFADTHQSSPLPGYTHTQQAMLSSFGHWALSFAEGLINDLTLLEVAKNLSNQNPLGTAAGFGVSFPLDRDQTCIELGFEKNIINSLFAQASRGKFESMTLEALSQIMLTLSRFSTDMLFFTARETEFIKVPDHLTTGSSIMPQKKNVDSMELMRGYTSIIFAHQLAIKNIPKGVISGYNRDLQLIKKPLIESFDIVIQSLKVARIYVDEMQVQEEAVRKAIKRDIYAADMANELVEKEGVSFRDAYVRVGLTLDEMHEFDPAVNILNKKSLGSPGNLDLDYYKRVVKGFGLTKKNVE